MANGTLALSQMDMLSQSGTGIVTIVPPATDTNRTLTLPDSTGTLFASGQALTATTGSFSGDVTLGSSVLATPSGSAPSYTCRAWVNFSGISTGTIRGSGNVSSITDNGVGRYRINLSTSMPDANYTITGNCSNRSGGSMFVAINSIVGSLSTLPTVDNFIVAVCTEANAAFDVDYVNIAIFG